MLELEVAWCGRVSVEPRCGDCSEVDDIVSILQCVQIVSDVERVLGKDAGVCAVLGGAVGG